MVIQSELKSFAISIHTVPESPYHDLVPLGQPILLRIEQGMGPSLSLTVPLFTLSTAEKRILA